MKSLSTLALLLVLASIANCESSKNFQPFENKTGARMAPFTQYNMPKTALIKLIRDVKTDLQNLKEPQTSYFGLVGIGTPAKTFRMTFDTASSDIWVPYYSWNPLATNLHYTRGYECKDSQTSDCTYLRKLNIHFRTTNLDVYTYNDVFTLFYDTFGFDQSDPNSMSDASGVSFRQIFAAAVNADNDVYKYRPEDGYIGLAPVTQSSSGITNFLISMQQEQQRREREQSLIYNQNSNRNSDLYQDQGQKGEGVADLVFGFWFNSDLSSKLGGELVLGGVDPSKYFGKFLYHKTNSFFLWSLELSNVLFNNRLISCPKGCNAILDTGANSIVGPQSDVQEIYKEIGARYDTASGLYLVDCQSIDRLPSFKFVIDDSPYLIYPAHYIKQVALKNKYYCYVAIKGWNRVDWNLGTDFIGAYYTFFDMTKRVVGFASPR